MNSGSSDHKIVIVAGTGFIGKYLAGFFADKGYRVTILTRGENRTSGTIRFVHWDVSAGGEWTACLEGAKAVVNLAGRSIDCIHNAKHKNEIIQSRVTSVAVLNGAIAQCKNPPEVFIQIGATGYYGDTGEVCTENSPNGNDFMARVCRMWEEAFFSSRLPATRKVLFRAGIVFGAGGGALLPLIAVTRLFLGGRAGSGKQVASWIHIEDLARMFGYAMANESVQGIYNAVAPIPVSNARLMRDLRKMLRRPWSPPVPAFAIRIAARVFLHTESSLILKGCHCLPERMEQSGYVFAFPAHEAALADIIKKNRNVTKNMH
jgi:uncharacterized protein (TIGR01777 family)